MGDGKTKGESSQEMEERGEMVGDLYLLIIYSVSTFPKEVGKERVDLSTVASPTGEVSLARTRAWGSFLGGEAGSSRTVRSQPGEWGQDIQPRR